MIEAQILYLTCSKVAFRTGSPIDTPSLFRLSNFDKISVFQVLSKNCIVASKLLSDSCVRYVVQKCIALYN